MARRARAARDAFDARAVPLDEVLRAVGEKYAVAPAFFRVLEDGETEVLLVA